MKFTWNYNYLWKKDTYEYESWIIYTLVNIVTCVSYNFETINSTHLFYLKDDPAVEDKPVVCLLRNMTFKTENIKVIPEKNKQPWLKDADPAELPAK